jgi:hypothetical protein
MHQYTVYEKQSKDGKVILKRILDKKGVKEDSEFNCLRSGPSAAFGEKAN